MGATDRWQTVSHTSIAERRAALTQWRVYVDNKVASLTLDLGSCLFVMWHLTAFGCCIPAAVACCYCLLLLLLLILCTWEQTLFSTCLRWTRWVSVKFSRGLRT